MAYTNPLSCYSSSAQQDPSYAPFVTPHANPSPLPTTPTLVLTDNNHPGFYRPFTFDTTFYLLNTFPIPFLATPVVVTPVAVPSYEPYSLPTPGETCAIPTTPSSTSHSAPTPEGGRKPEEPLLGSNGTQGGSPLESTKETPSELGPTKKTKTRLQDTPRFRYKQDLIENTMKELHTMFDGRVLPEDEALRGPTTIRLHVKTETAIRSIVDCMTQVSNIPGVVITQLSTPVSMKNRYQKKGFLCYFRISDVDMVEEVLHHVKSTFPCFERCKVAIARHNSTRSARTVRMPSMAFQHSCEAA